MRKFILLLFVFAGASPAFGQIQHESLQYRDGDTLLRGYIAWDDAISGKRPGVLLAHEWWGMNDYARQRADMLASLGYVAFALDMYGDDKVTGHGKQASEWMKQISGNIQQWRHRAELGLQKLREHKRVDDKKIAAIGYCFGGATVMQLAYAGADLRGVVSFHGSLPVASPADAKHIESKILVEHGSADPFVPVERIRAFQQALDQADVDWQMDIYGGARHSFTNPNAKQYGIEALVYDESADRRSWAQMQRFLKEVFAQP
ncbi:MAG: dienelactone hydrolase family protein [gamma proteobacterium symbiont of Bathyaustriella thionipta]|nr:dienelactone hydrolase family protein [gamma proteobacterium symbiont of Bathyaustriella thionipta]